MTVRTRFAPSPTGFLHIGGARTALFSWAFAKKHGGDFILRIEDTDVARSTPEAVQAILDGMQWLGLDYDEGPFYQMQRMDRYKQVIQTMLDAGSAYYCYSSKEELEALREQQMANKQKPRYDGKWRPETGKVLPVIPQDVAPVIRFKNPQDGAVAWDDLVKGRIEIANAELDDLIIARADGTPTYNFCVVVDDSDMGITQVIRGDDHVNNTPRQINMLMALASVDPAIKVPQYAHLSMILGSDGQKLSKRHGAVSVMQYDEDGYLPEAVLNYLARLGWSHGDDEVFSKQQFAEWFDLDHITPSAAQFNTEKLNWLNAHYIKQADIEYLVSDITKRLKGLNITVSEQPNLSAVIELYKERVNTLNELASNIAYFYQKPVIDQAAAEKHLTADIKPVLATLVESLYVIDWQAEQIHHAINEAVTQYQLKFPKVAMPLRVMLTGIAQSPSIDQVMALLGKDEVLARINSALN
jgi:glutamyl-tRNA synthetase